MHDFYTINPDDNSYEWRFRTYEEGDEYNYHDNDGLAWDGNYLWSVGSPYYNDIYGVYLYQFDTVKNGEVRRIRLDFLTYRDYPDGLTYDGEAFWLTTWKDPPKIYRISPEGRSLGHITPHWETGNVVEKPFAVAFEFPAE